MIIRATSVGFVSLSDNLCHLCLFDTKFLDAVAELPERQSQELCRCSLVIAGFFEGLDDGLALHVFYLFAQIAGDGGLRLLRAAGLPNVQITG